VDPKRRDPFAGRAFAGLAAQPNRGMPRVDGSQALASFDWPPNAEALDSPVLELGDGPEPPSLNTATPPSAASQPVAAADPPSPLSKALRDPAPKPSVATPLPEALVPVVAARPSIHWARDKVLPLAMVFLALIAAAETVFIARTLLRQGPEASSDASTGSPAALPLPSAIDRPTVAQTGDIQHAGVTPSGSRPAAAAARLIIDSDPAGASVVVDGRYHGATPLTVRDIAEGDHRLVLKRNGREVRQRVHVNAGEATSVVVPLPARNPSSGWVGIVASLELDVYENGSLVGTSRVPRIMLSAGVHTLRLENQATGFRHEEQVEIRSGQRTELAVQLPQSTIHLNAMPWADVWIDGKAIGQTPIGNVPIVIGPHEVVFRHPELGEKTISTLVKAGVPTRLAVNLTRP